MPQSTAKTGFGQTTGAKSGNREKAAGKKLWLYLRGEQIVNRRVLDPRHGSDVEDIQIISAKHHARNILDRHADTAIDGTVRCVANQFTSDDLRIPHKTFFVHRRTVRYTRIFSGRREHAFVREISGFNIIIVGPKLLLECIR